jgi:hypothetical protein
MITAVLVHEQLGAIEDIQLDTTKIYNILGGRATFIGQWPEIDVVIMKAVTAERENENQLPPPFHEERVDGKILLVRMDEDSEPQDFTSQEYLAWVEQTPPP